ncbi:hypothetical protein CCGE525_26050 (plasmid) [Rhizobium jaguaris]|uniref:Uncharacterized protein n=1 Tax=Rhizobium jaguaris TaxID=1312183 RepID=A0A387FYH3_9HYPH|nr:hypothetical protein CCGE525_26050 [Rhizobium jaguaris]
MPQNVFPSLASAHAGGGEIRCLAIWSASSVWSCSTAFAQVYSNVLRITEEQQKIGGEVDE